MYERTIHADIQRIWENVRDWEHLPWLHREAFESIDLVEEDENLWVADVGVAGGGISRVRVAMEPEELRYTTSTVGGVGEGTDIVTELRPRPDGDTDISVSFHAPDVADDDRAELFRFYRDLYSLLWDQDEAMMVRRTVLLSRDDKARANARGRVAIGSIEEITSRLPITIEAGGRSYRVIRSGDALVAYSATCPHLGGPLDACEPSGGVVVCPWHGYAFDVRTGACISGQPFRLAAAPKVVQDDDSRTVYFEFDRGSGERVQV